MQFTVYIVIGTWTNALYQTVFWRNIFLSLNNCPKINYIGFIDAKMLSTLPQKYLNISRTHHDEAGDRVH